MPHILRADGHVFIDRANCTNCGQPYHEYIAAAAKAQCPDSRRPAGPVVRSLKDRRER